MNIVEQKHWDESYRNWEYYVAENEVTDFLDKWLDYLKGKIRISNCFEVGCYPGSYLAHISKKYGLCANGVDLTPELGERFTEWLLGEGIRVGDFFCEDAFECIKKQKELGIVYDLVYSLGFIEHFEEYIDVLKIHGEILKNNGLLIATTPNYAGLFQRVMHILTDKRNYDRHVIKSMNPIEWKTEMEKEGYKTVFCGYFGVYDFWVDKQKRSIIQKILLRTIMKLKNPMRKFLKNDSRFFSPYCGIVMIKG